MVSGTMSAGELTVLHGRVDDRPDIEILPDRPSPPRWRWRLGVVSVLLLAGALRLVPFTSGLPYLAYVDEGHIFVHGAAMIRENTTDPGWYDYPTLPVTLAAAVERTTMATEPAVQRQADLRALALTTNYDEVRPESAVLLMRLLVVALAVGTVALVMLAARRLVGRRAMIVAGVLAAVSPALIQRGTFDLVDTMLTFFVIAAFVAGFSVDRGRCRREVVCRSLLAGVLCGLAMGTKYPGVLAVAMVLVLVSGAGRLRIVERAWRATLVVAAAAATFVMTMPAVLGNRQAVVDGVTANYDMYRVKSLEGVNYWQAIRQVGEVGVLGLIVAAVGTGVMLAARGSRRATVAWLGYSAVLALVASRLAFQPFRNLLSIVPFLCIAMAAAVVAVAEVLARETPTRGRRWARTGAIVVLTMVLAGVSFQSGVRPFYAANVNVDTRVVARRWLQAHVRAGDKVIVAAELGIAQRELKQIPGTVEVVSIHDKVVPADLAGVRYVVTGLPFAGGFSWLPGPGFTFLESWGATPLPEASNLFHTNTLLVQVAEDRP